MISARRYSSQSHNNHAPEDDDNNSAITAAVIAADNIGPCLYSVSWRSTAECDALKKRNDDWRDDRSRKMTEGVVFVLWGGQRSSCESLIRPYEYFISWFRKHTNRLHTSNSCEIT